ncbi:Thiamine-phosphate synthase [Luteitalea pratensis]|uniref:Thiamine-phosphate synthase n=1 Tax=Luteitalea pratensis TaxID=1855912 RepID=A0A143PR76_LUTPR|nr:thiamine phosphate synthase [Luteitalea pratensis]AMY10931.1 Thiamine-phosphate synthase [Luteitalea pratensis]
MSSTARRPLPSRLYAIVDADVASRAGWHVPDLADAYLQAGVRFLQVRAKDAPARDVLAWTEAIARRAGEAWVIVNDRVDIAIVAGTRHVHLGQDDLPVSDARALLGPDAVIGLSTHTPAQVDAACALPIDYLAVGPVFSTQTKATGYEAVGLAGVRRAHAAAQVARVPVVAIGGITLDTASDVIAAGASSVAVITDLLREGTPGARVRAFVERLSRI